MSADLALQAIETAAVVVGVVFGLIQLRQLRYQREIQARIELLRPLHSLMMPENVMAIYALPDGLNGKQIRKKLGDRFGSILAVLGLFESLGPLIARGRIGLRPRSRPRCASRSSRECIPAQRTLPGESRTRSMGGSLSDVRLSEGWGEAVQQGKP